MLAGLTFGCSDSEYCRLACVERCREGWVNGIGTLLGPERTRECLSVIGHLPRMNHLGLLRPAFAVE